MFDALAVGLIGAGGALIAFRRWIVRLFIFQWEIIFGLRVVRANEQRIATFPIVVAVLLILLGIAEWLG